MNISLKKKLLIAATAFLPLMALADDPPSKKVYPSVINPLEIATKIQQEALQKKSTQFNVDNNMMTAMAGGAIVGMHTLPDSDLRVVQLDNDDMFLVTGNGRFIIKMSMMLDIWKSNRIRKYSDLGDVDKVTLEQMRVDVGTLGRYSFGQGKKIISILHDPSDPITKQLFDVMINMEEEYVFRLIPLPSAKKGSMQKVGKFWCAIPTGEMFDFVRNGESFTNLANPTKECNVNPVQVNIGLASILNIKELPYTIRHDGKHKAGLPNSSDEFYEWIHAGD